jgi:hypothetical protein
MQGVNESANRRSHARWERMLRYGSCDIAYSDRPTALRASAGTV